MKLNTTKQKSPVDEFMPIAEKLKAEGIPEHLIYRYFKNFVHDRSIKFYREQNVIKPIRFFINTDDIREKANADSKIERIFFDALREAGIRFKFQYRVGKYKIDFLIGTHLAVEIDGPQHELSKEKDHRRDEYIRSQGFTVVRIPIWLIVNDMGAVIKELKEATNGK